MPKTTDAERENRLMVLEQHMEDLDFQGKEYSRKDLLNHLKRKGFKISKTTLVYDLEELATNNKFVENIGMHYSQYMENVSKTYDKAEARVWKIHDQKWTQSKIVKKQAIAKDGGTVDLTEVVTTKEIAGPKLGALKLIIEIAKARQELASGKNLEISAAMWVKKEKELQEEIKRLKSILPKEDVIIIGNKINTNR